MSPRNNEAFQRTYLTYRNLMYHIAQQIVKNPSDAEDVVADAFMKIYRNYHCIKQPVCEQTKRFVVVVTERTALNQIRKNRHTGSLSLDELALFEGTEQISDDAIALWDALQQLPDDNRTAFLLSCYCGMTAKETAAIMGCSAHRVEKLISRSKEKLKLYLEVQP